MDPGYVKDLATAKLILSICLTLIAMLGGGVLFFLKGLHDDVKSIAGTLVKVEKEVAVLKYAVSRRVLKGSSGAEALFGEDETGLHT